MNKLKAIFSAEGRIPSICEACKESFVCGVTIFGCWCTKIKLSAETRASLQKQFHGCLCQDCLLHFNTTEQKIVTSAPQSEG